MSARIVEHFLDASPDGRWVLDRAQKGDGGEWQLPDTLADLCPSGGPEPGRGRSRRVFRVAGRPDERDDTERAGRGAGFLHAVSDAGPGVHADLIPNDRRPGEAAVCIAVQGVVEVRPEGRVVVPGTAYLAGSWAFTDRCIGNVMRMAGVSLAEAVDMAGARPRELLGLPSCRLEVGQPADLVLFDWEAGGDFEVLAASIREKLFTLGDAVRFYPGHGPSALIGEERRTNPFVGEAARSKK